MAGETFIASLTLPSVDFSWGRLFNVTPAIILVCIVMFCCVYCRKCYWRRQTGTCCHVTVWRTVSRRPTRTARSPSAAIRRSATTQRHLAIDRFIYSLHSLRH